jgi:hypothetical protein
MNHITYKGKSLGSFNLFLVAVREAKNFNLQVSSWMVLMESCFSKEESLTENLNARCSLFLKVGLFSLFQRDDSRFLVVLQ